MTKTLDIDLITVKDDIGCYIAQKWCDWDWRRQVWKTEKDEVQRYVFATDTTKTSNSSLPWSNKTTIPKLCQIRDNLFANYMATMFPKKKNIEWQSNTKDDQDEAKTSAIEAYMTWVCDKPEYYHEVAKLVLDYIDYGNTFVMPEWVDERTPATGTEVPPTGYVGPALRRINPTDIVFDPTAVNFTSSPKIIRSIISLGELKEMMARESKSEQDQEDSKALFEYLKDIRKRVAEFPGELTVKDSIYQVAGFDNFRAYLASDNVEVLTFYGDIYVKETDTYKRNQIIKIADRHKVISERPNPSIFGHAPIYHVGWRVRPDNLWAMGPLDNLVGLQYRVDHLENMKADIWDLTRFPVFKVKGLPADDWTWRPGERIHIDMDSDVELLAPDVGALQANTEIAILEQKMEEMAGSPKEAMGFRTPGEKTKYEVQRLENAASRIFQNKISQFEMHLVEPALNAMLELSRRNMDTTTIRIFDDEFKINTFKDLTPEDITGNGRIRPMAARHFAEQAQMVQDLNAFMSSAAGNDAEVLMHFSAIKLARMWEKLLDLEDYNLVQPYVRITERADAQHLQNVATEQMQMNTMTSSGMGTDYDTDAAEQAPQPMVSGAQEQGAAGQPSQPGNILA